MDFSNLTEENINQAIQFIEKNKVPPGYKSKTADLVVDGKPYPPKYVLVVAQKIADGSVIDVKDFHTRDAVDFLQERGYNIVKREKEPEMSDEEKFKCLLEYFVAHLEYKQSGIQNTFGYQKYIQPLQGHFTETGNGEKDWGLQQQIEKWNSYSNGRRITITINGMSKIRFASKASFLNWKDTWFNVRAKWDDSDKRVVGFYLTNTPPPFKRVGEEFSLKDLCLYDGKAPNEKLKKLFNDFEKLIGEKSMSEYIKEITKLLLNNHNIILHGAPGTGKTYLTKKIAGEMGAEFEMIQFHQSYDYTDFVEGLRPVQKTESTQISFERQDGIFKAFCAKAQKNLEDSAKSQEVQSIEAYWSAKIDAFLDAVMDGEISQENWQTSKTANHFTISSDDSNIFVSIPENPKTAELKFPKETLVQLLSNNLDLKKVVDIKAFYNRKHHFQSDSYAFVLYHKIKDWIAKKEDIPKIENIVQKKDYVFIIDEINRGEMSKIFGELFFSIDPGYRGKSGDVRTQYANLQKNQNEFDKALGVVDPNNFGHFFVPENVYIIGTMNDIDRSVESMDFAMRRRFAFKEIKADERIEMLDSLKCGKKNEAIKCMQALNKEIESISGLSSAYHIGPAYFLKLDNYEGTFEDLWKYHIEGVLREYLRGMPKAAEHLAKLKECYDTSIASESSASSDNTSDSAENP